MQYIITTILLLTMSFAGFAQTRADYEKVMSKFQKFYNDEKDDSILKMYNKDWKGFGDQIWKKGTCREFIKEFGKIRSYKLITIVGSGDKFGYFKTVLTKSTQILVFTLEQGNGFGTFHFPENTPFADSLLRLN